MKELSLHILDIAENSINAKASRISILVHEDIPNDEIIIQVKDNGEGINKEILDLVADPFVTTRTTRKVGLGIPLLKAATEETNGHFTIDSEVKKGTDLTAKFQRSHIDRMPIGDLKSTLLNLLISYPEIDWEFRYSINNMVFEMTNSQIKEILGDLPLSEPAVLKYIRTMIETGIEEVQRAFEFASTN